MDFPDKADLEARRYFLKRTEAALQKADGIMAISEFTKKALQESFELDEGRKIKVTYLGLNAGYEEAAGTSRGRSDPAAVRPSGEISPFRRGVRAPQKPSPLD